MNESLIFYFIPFPAGGLSIAVVDALVTFAGAGR